MKQLFFSEPVDVAVIFPFAEVFPKLYASHCEEGLIPITLGLPPIPELFVDERRFFDISCLIKSTTALTRDGSVKQFLCTRLVSVLMKYPK